MSSREDILQSIRRNTRVRYEKPDLSGLEHEALTYEDKLSKFCEILKQVGGQAVILKDKENVNDMIKAAYPEAKRIASTIKEIKTNANKNLISASNPAVRFINSPRFATKITLIGKSRIIIAVFATNTDEKYFPADS